MPDYARMSDPELEQALLESAGDFRYPATPQLARPVRTRIERRSEARWRRLFLPRVPSRAPLIAVAAIAIAVLAAALNPAVRSAVAHFFHVQGVVVTRTPSPLPSLSPVPLNLGTRVSLEQAQKAVQFPVVIPADLGAPDAVYLDRRPGITEVVLAYLPRPGIPQTSQTGLGALVTEFQGLTDGAYLRKMLDPRTTLEETSVDKDPAYWIAGNPHQIVVVGPDGDARPETLRLAANTLVWARSGVTYRIESSLSKADAVRIAESMR